MWSPLRSPNWRTWRTDTYASSRLGRYAVACAGSRSPRRAGRGSRRRATGSPSNCWRSNVLGLRSLPAFERGHALRSRATTTAPAVAVAVEAAFSVAVAAHRPGRRRRRRRDRRRARRGPRRASRPSRLLAASRSLAAVSCASRPSRLLRGRRRCRCRAPGLGRDRGGRRRVVGIIGIVGRRGRAGIVAGPADEARTAPDLGRRGVVCPFLAPIGAIGRCGSGAALGAAPRSAAIGSRLGSAPDAPASARLAPSSAARPVSSRIMSTRSDFFDRRRLAAERRHDGGELVAVFAFELGTIELRIQAHSRPLGCSDGPTSARCDAW